MVLRHLGLNAEGAYGKNEFPRNFARGPPPNGLYPQDAYAVRNVRKLASKLGYRFRLQRRDLPGTPDLVFPSRLPHPTKGRYDGSMQRSPLRNPNRPLTEPEIIEVTFLTGTAIEMDEDRQVVAAVGWCDVPSQGERRVKVRVAMSRSDAEDHCRRLMAVLGIRAQGH
jgi:hypothetical protein